MTYFLNRGTGERGTFSLDDPINSITQTHDMDEKPLDAAYIWNLFGAGKIDHADEPSFAECTRPSPGLSDYGFPPTVGRGAAATVLADFTLPSLLREALSGLWAQGLLENKARGRQLQGDELLEVLHARSLRMA